MELHLDMDKETPKKIRWAARPPDEDLKIYIPKWRVPEPVPGVVTIDITSSAERHTATVTRTDVARSPVLRRKSIEVLVTREERLGHSIRYMPEGDDHDWEIGKVYIPYRMTHGEARKLWLVVNWQL